MLHGCDWQILSWHLSEEHVKFLIAEYPLISKWTAKVACFAHSWDVLGRVVCGQVLQFLQPDRWGSCRVWVDVLGGRKWNEGIAPLPLHHVSKSAGTEWIPPPASETIGVSLRPCHTEEYLQHLILNHLMSFVCHTMPEGWPPIHEDCL